MLFKFIKEETHFYIINHKSDLACFSGRNLPERRGFSTLRSSAPAEPQLWAKRLAPLPPQWLHAESASWTSYPAQRGDMHQLPRRVPARSQSPHTSQSLEVSSVWLLFLIELLSSCWLSCTLRYLLPNSTPLLHSCVFWGNCEILNSVVIWLRTTVWVTFVHQWMFIIH